MSLEWRYKIAVSGLGLKNDVFIYRLDSLLVIRSFSTLSVISLSSGLALIDLTINLQYLLGI